MKRIVLICLCFFVAFLPVESRAMQVSAKAAILIDAKYGKVIFQKNATDKMTMASTTKIMTAICAIEEGDLDKVYKVDDRAVGIEGSSMYLTRGESLTLGELVCGLMLNSGNDAAVAIAYAVSGSVEKFAQLMNEKAAAIGAADTSFKNPNGLDEKGHYTTAADLAKIAAYAMKNDDFKKIVSTYSMTVSGPEGKRYLTNHNKLLKRLDGCVGVKTGFTKKSGRCLVSACERNGVMLVAVTLNAPDDWNDHTRMMDYGYEHISLKKVLSQGEKAGSVNVIDGTKKKIGVICQTSFDIPAFDGAKYMCLIAVPKYITAPIKKGQVIAQARIMSDGKCVDSVNLVAADEAEALQKRSVSKTIRHLYSLFLEI